MQKKAARLLNRAASHSATFCPAHSLAPEPTPERFALKRALKVLQRLAATSYDCMRLRERRNRKVRWGVSSLFLDGERDDVTRLFDRDASSHASAVLGSDV